MESWVTKDNIKQTIIPELNHIWEPSKLHLKQKTFSSRLHLNAITSTRSLIKSSKHPEKICQV